MKKILLSLALAIGAGSALADKQQVTVVMNSASTMSQGVALALSTQMQMQGGQVHILLCDKAADIALKEAGGEKLKPTEMTPAEMLTRVMKQGATASVCALYLPNTGHKIDELKEVVTAARPDEMGRALLEPQRKVVVF